MKGKNGFTLIELLAVIVILAIVTVLGATTVLPYFQNSNKKTFMVEANNVEAAASQAIGLYQIKQLSIPASNISDGKNIIPTTYCMTLNELVENGLWTKNANAVAAGGDYEGKVIVTQAAKSKSYTYTVTMHNDKWKISNYTGEVKESEISAYTADDTDSYTCEGSTNGLSTELVAGLYRFQGTTANNYICFGTTDKTTCTGDTDKYMYRIIGGNAAGQMKLIKKETLNTSYAWNTINTDITWPNSSLYNGLNGSYFLTNTTYVPSGWSNRIATTNWHYGVISDVDVTAETLASSELGVSTTVNAKIGLLYLHDYYYGLPGGNNCYDTYNCYQSWIFFKRNDSSTPSSYEWTISQLYENTAWYIAQDGIVYENNLNFPFSVRPVFYLNENQVIASGSGTLNDPYVLS